MIKRLSLLTLAFAAFLAPADRALAQPPGGPAANAAPRPLPFVSPIFGENMVMQRNKPNTIWGWTDPGTTVQVQMGEQTASAVANPDRRWQAKIQPPPAGGPYSLKITGGSNTVELKNVMVGDVWLCAGQSNMGFSLRESTGGTDEAKTADLPDIRFFNVGQKVTYHKNDVPSGSWRVVSPQTAGGLSATAYYFAKRIKQEIGVPIGLIIDSVGGTPAETWTSEAALREIKDFDVPLAELARLRAANAREDGYYINHWYEDYDIGLKEKWASPDFDDSSWKTVDVPGGFAELGVPETPALVWFRKEFTMPDPVPTGRMTVLLGQVERMDTVFINGTQIGGSAWVENPRRYGIRAGLLKPGKNVIAIRVLKSKPVGGFLSKPEQLMIQMGDSSIPLAGKWKAKLSVDGRPPQKLPLAYENWPVMPTVLYEGMIAPLAPVSLTGAIWYQAEQNSERGYHYRRILAAMIKDWRRAFQQGDFPFYIVGLPGYKAHSDVPVDDEWAETRESQAVVANTVPNTCLATTIDVGDAENIHTPEKRPAGDRLARCALANYYGKKNVVFQGPTVASVKRNADSIEITFKNTDGGLVAKGGKLLEFAIAGDDRKWVWADARIDGNKIVVSSPSVKNPKQVRYAWQSYPTATLFNGEGLPAPPFRTDDWPGKTQGRLPY